MTNDMRPNTPVDVLPDSKPSFVRARRPCISASQ
jgi:hypothetical protein